MDTKDIGQTKEQAAPCAGSGNFMSSFTKWLARPQVWGFFLSMAVCAIVSLAFFAPDNFQGNTLQQYDMQQGAANGHAAQEYERQTGEKALWTNSLFSGMPTFQIAPEYPSNSLFTWLNGVYGLGLPGLSSLMFMMMFGMLIMLYCWRLRWWYALIGALSWGLVSYFVIIIGAGHIWKFMALTYVPPVIGGLYLAYRGRYLAGAAIMALFAMLQLNANHPQITYYSAFVMVALVIAWLVRDIRKKHLRCWCIATAVSLASAALALGANLPALYHTYEYAKETKRAQSELLADDAAHGVQSAKPADPKGPTGGLPREEIGGWSNTPSETLSLLIPNIKGGASIRPEKGANVPLSLDKSSHCDFKMQSNDQFGLMSQFTEYFGGKGMTNGPFYLGAIIIALFILGCFIVRGPTKWALLVLTLFSAFLAMGNHFEALTDFMIDYVPLYNKFRAAETALVIACVCVPLLAMLGLQKLMEEKDGLRRYKNELIASFGFCIILCLFVFVAPGFFGEPLSEDETQWLVQAKEQMAQSGAPAEYYGYIDTTISNIKQIRLDIVSADALRSALFLILGGVLVFVAACGKLKRGYVVAGLGLLVVVDMYGVDKRYISSESYVNSANAFVQSFYADPLAADSIDNVILRDKGYYRVADFDNFGGYRRSYYHNMVGGYHAAKLNRYNDLIDTHTIFEPSVLDMLNAKYVIFNGRLETNPRACGPAWLVDSVRYVDGARAEIIGLKGLDSRHVAVADSRFVSTLGQAVATTVGDTVVLARHTPNTLEYKVTSARGGIMVCSEVWFPWGWRATIDGKEAQIGRVDYVLRAIRVPAGTHNVEMTFDPQSMHTTATVAYISIILIYLLVLSALGVRLTCRATCRIGGDTSGTGGEIRLPRDDRQKL